MLKIKSMQLQMTKEFTTELGQCPPTGTGGKARSCLAMFVHPSLCLVLDAHSSIAWIILVLVLVLVLVHPSPSLMQSLNFTPCFMTLLLAQHNSRSFILALCPMSNAYSSILGYFVHPSAEHSYLRLVLASLFLGRSSPSSEDSGCHLFSKPFFVVG